MPVCAKPEVCECTEWVGECCVKRRAYVVVQHCASWWWKHVKWSEVIVGQLSVETVETVGRRFVPWLASQRSTFTNGPDGSLVGAIRAWLELAKVLPSAVERGSFSGGTLCGCTLLDVCASCLARVGPSRFLSEGRYSGVYPYGEEHWWGGATDGAVMCIRDGVAWKVCADSAMESWHGEGGAAMGRSACAHMEMGLENCVIKIGEYRALL